MVATWIKNKIIGKILFLTKTKVLVACIVASGASYIGSDKSIVYVDRVIKAKSVKKEAPIAKHEVNVITVIDTVNKIDTIYVDSSKFKPLNENFLYAQADTSIQTNFDSIEIKYVKGKFDVFYRFRDSVVNLHPIFKGDSVKIPIANLNPKNTMNDTINIRSGIHIGVKKLD